MKLVSNTIYRCIPFVSSPVMPTLKITGAATIYVSLSQTKPADVSEMDNVTSQTTIGYNVLNGQIRYICAVFGNDASVEESGIVSTQEHIDR